MARSIYSNLACWSLLIAICGAARATPAQEAGMFWKRYEPGSIVISNHERRLCYVLGEDQAKCYKVAVGKPGSQWVGETTLRGKFPWPAWMASTAARYDMRDIPSTIAGGAPNNPMGAYALELANADCQSPAGCYAIHGTSQRMRASVGTWASHGCFRMLNEDVIDLAGRVEVGTKVFVIN
jgi:lipoprotein-anchoring transpeptidase ErfK/SrfK